MNIENFFLILLAPWLWASATLTDKMLVSGHGEDSRSDSLMAISGFFNVVTGLLIILPIVLWRGQFHEIVELPMEHIAPLILNGATQTAAMLLFLKALTGEEVSRVDPWFQTIPVWGMVLAYLTINEALAWYHIVAIGVIATGGWIIMSKGVAGRKVVMYMTTSAFLLAVNDVTFAAHGRELHTMPAVFLDMSGKAFFGLALLAGQPAAQRGFIVGLRTKFGLQTLSEALFISADFFFDRAKLFAPVALVQGVAAGQPMFTILGATLITRFGPRVMAALVRWKASKFSWRNWRSWRKLFAFIVLKTGIQPFAEEQGVTLWKKFGGIILIVAGGVVIASF